MNTTTTPASAVSTPRRRVQESIELTMQRKITGISPLTMWETAGAVLEILLQPDVAADIEHLIRQAGIARRKTPG